MIIKKSPRFDSLSTLTRWICYCRLVDVVVIQDVRQTKLSISTNIPIDKHYGGPFSREHGFDLFLIMAILEVGAFFICRCSLVVKVDGFGSVVQFSVPANKRNTKTFVWAYDQMTKQFQHRI